MIEYVGIGILFVLAIWDALRKSVPVWTLCLFSVIAMMGLWSKSRVEKIYDLFLILIVGAFWLMLRKKSVAGGADFWTLAACAQLFSAAVLHAGILIAGVLSGITGVFLYFKEKDSTRTLPFLPFLFIGILAGKVCEKVCGS